MIITIPKYKRNKADKFFAKNKFKIALYKVTTDFGLSEIGEIREVYLINDEGDKGLIYHPSDRSGCGSFELVKKHDGDEYWVSWDKNTFTNYEEFGCGVKI